MAWGKEWSIGHDMHWDLSRKAGDSFIRASFPHLIANVIPVITGFILFPWLQGLGKAGDSSSV